VAECNSDSFSESLSVSELLEISPNCDGLDAGDEHEFTSSSDEEFEEIVLTATFRFLRRGIYSDEELLDLCLLRILLSGADDDGISMSFLGVIFRAF
jgi:hypothetical protein